jgi:hypothetical protein
MISAFGVEHGSSISKSLPPPSGLGANALKRMPAPTGPGLSTRPKPWEPGGDTSGYVNQGGSAPKPWEPGGNVGEYARTAQRSNEKPKPWEPGGSKDKKPNIFQRHKGLTIAGGTAGAVGVGGAGAYGYHRRSK